MAAYRTASPARPPSLASTARDAWTPASEGTSARRQRAGGGSRQTSIPLAIEEVGKAGFESRRSRHLSPPLSLSVGAGPQRRAGMRAWVGRRRCDRGRARRRRRRGWGNWCLRRAVAPEGVAGGAHAAGGDDYLGLPNSTLHSGRAPAAWLSRSSRAFRLTGGRLQCRSSALRRRTSCLRSGVPMQRIRPAVEALSWYWCRVRPGVQTSVHRRCRGALRLCSQRARRGAVRPDGHPYRPAAVCGDRAPT
jgi:hypothetical protein